MKKRKSRCMHGKRITYSQVFDAALEQFHHDKDKTIVWWMTKVPEMDNLSPFEMVRNGHGWKILKIIMG